MFNKDVYCELCGHRRNSHASCCPRALECTDVDQKSTPPIEGVTLLDSIRKSWECRVNKHGDGATSNIQFELWLDKLTPYELLTEISDHIGDFTIRK